MIENKFLGMPYPIVKHARGYFHTQSGVNQIKSDLLALLLTNTNERVMLPDFGVSLRQFLFEPADPFLIDRVRTKIEQQLRQWEPRVVIEQIEISLNPDESSLNTLETGENEGSILFIKIMFFDPENIREVQELRLEVPLST